MLGAGACQGELREAPETDWKELLSIVDDVMKAHAGFDEDG
jgi:hypothetical protein